MSARIVRRFLLAAALAAVSGCGPFFDEARITLGRHEYCVPKEYILNSPLPGWLKSVAKLPPSSPGITLLFPADEVAARIKGFRKFNGQIVDNLMVGVELLDADGMRAYSDPEMHVFSDAWYGRNRYEDEVLAPHRSGLYQLRGVMWPVIWKVLKIRPDPSVRSPDDPYSWHMGSCYEVNSPLAEAHPQYNCSTKYLHENLQITAYFDEINLAVVEEIRAFVVERLQSWSMDSRAAVLTEAVR